MAAMRMKAVSPVSALLLSRTFKTIPQPPGGVVGDANDATPVSPPHKLDGSIHWTTEKFVAAGLVPLVVAPLFTGVSTVVDSLLLALLLYHCFAGFQSCITDYIPKRVYGVYHSMAMYLLMFGTGVAGYGCYQIEQKEGGITRVVGRLWKA